MNNYQVKMLISLFILAGCASTSDVYQNTKELFYEPQPANEKVIELYTPLLAKKLKDRDSLKNLEIMRSYKCYASKMEISDNISPKYDYGYWCFEFSFNATNSYGGYVKNQDYTIFYKGQLYTADQLNEVVRKFDDVNVYHTGI